MGSDEATWKRMRGSDELARSLTRLLAKPYSGELDGPSFGFGGDEGAALLDGIEAPTVADAVAASMVAKAVSGDVAAQRTVVGALAGGLQVARRKPGGTPGKARG